MDRKIHVLLRAALAFSFIYPPISAFLNPYAWVGYFPTFLTTLPIDQLVLLHVFGVFEIMLAIWILSGKHMRIAASIAAATLAVIVLFNLSQLDVLFRDIPILMIAIALVYTHPKHIR